MSSHPTSHQPARHDESKITAHEWAAIVRSVQDLGQPRIREIHGTLPSIHLDFGNGTHAVLQAISSYQWHANLYGAQGITLIPGFRARAHTPGAAIEKAVEQYRRRNP